MESICFWVFDTLFMKGDTMQIDRAPRRDARRRGGGGWGFAKVRAGITHIPFPNFLKIQLKTFFALFNS